MVNAHDPMAEEEARRVLAQPQIKPDSYKW